MRGKEGEREERRRKKRKARERRRGAGLKEAGIRGKRGTH
jgi:hypothetical protein